ncbi:MAG: hypothetical protein ACPGID_00235 [Rubricella sp.]
MRHVDFLPSLVLAAALSAAQPLASQSVDILHAVPPGPVGEGEELSAAQAGWRTDPRFPNAEFRNFSNGQIARPTVDALDPSGEEIELRLTGIYLEEQRDRREDLYFVLTVIAGDGVTRSMVTPVWDGLDEGVLYRRNYLVFRGDPHTELEVTAMLFDEEGRTADNLADIVKVIGVAADVVTFVASGGTVTKVVSGSLKVIPYILGEIGDIGDDDYYGSDTLSWEGDAAITPGSFEMRFYEPDEGFGDRGHDVRVTFEIRPYVPDPPDGPPDDGIPECDPRLRCEVK